MTSGIGVLCVGASHWDVIGRTDAHLHVGDDVAGRIERRPGGVATNVARGLAKHGVSAGLCSVIGDDPAGRALILGLEDAGIDCAHLCRIAGAATGHYVAIEDHRGELFAAVADTALLEHHSDQVLRQVELALNDTRSVFVDANLGTAELEQIADACRNAGARVFLNPVSPMKAPRLSFLLTGAYEATLIANLAEASALMQQTFENSADAAAAMQARASGTVLITHGSGPATLATPDETVTMSPPALSGDASVTGAGDALLSGFLSAQERDAAPAAALHFALEAAAGHMTDGKTR